MNKVANHLSSRLKTLLVAATALGGLGFAMPAQAVSLAIAGYDINDAVLSGHGNWFHTFSGTITPGTAFTNFTFPGVTATYSGVGSGTLNDGVIGTSESASQLFVTPSASDGTTINPAIFLTLSNASTINTINLFGGDFFNGIPGRLTGVTVGLLKTDFTLVSETFSTSAFGPDFGLGQVNDLVNLAGSSLDGVAAYTVILSNFQGTESNWFSLTEIELDGELATTTPTAVPEPATWAMMLLGMGMVGSAMRRNRRQKAGVRFAF